MPDFHETRMGQEFFLKKVPEIIRQLTRIANAMEGGSKNEHIIKCYVMDTADFSNEILSASCGEVGTTIKYHAKEPHADYICLRATNHEECMSFEDSVPLIKEVLHGKIDKGYTVAEIKNVGLRDGLIYISYTQTPKK